MKSRKLLFTAMLLVGGIVANLTLSSNSGGKMGVSTTGCGGGGCHAASTGGATTISVTGIPATGFVAGSTYAMSLKVMNAIQVAAGFDLSITTGTLSGAPANTMLMGGNELHHTAPKNFTAGEVEWLFNWTAPASGNTVSFKVAGNAVNLTGSISGDSWVLSTATFNKEWATNVENVENTVFRLYPNPATDYVIMKSANGFENTNFNVISLNGSVLTMKGQNTRDKNECRISTASLPTGQYILYFEANGKTQSFPFRKN